eukprot:Nk52_evm80s212 gene=Nk52_evmTU80s212
MPGTVTTTSTTAPHTTDYLRAANTSHFTGGAENNSNCISNQQHGAESNSAGNAGDSSSAAVMMPQKNLDILIADTAGYIKNARFDCIAEQILTTEEVIREIRDARSRQNFDLSISQTNVREPSAEAINAVVEFAKKTGDFRSLSVADLKVIALTWMIEKEQNGIEHLRKEPVTGQGGAKAKVRNGGGGLNPRFMVGFYHPDSGGHNNNSGGEQQQKKKKKKNKKKKSQGQGLEVSNGNGNGSSALSESENEAVKKGEETSSLSGANAAVDGSDRNTMENNGSGCLEEELAKKCSVAVCEHEDDAEEERLLVVPKVGGTAVSGSSVEKEKKVAAENENEEQKEKFEQHLPNQVMFDADDVAGWIGPDNVKEVKSKDLSANLTGDHSSAKKLNKFGKPFVKIGCMTADFAMQNVIIQMGMKVVSVDGMYIRKVKQFVLKCHACFQVCKDMSRDFCPSCGNATLLKIAVTLDEKGNITHFHYNKNKSINLRGTQYSIPDPKGGRNTGNIILREDQREYETKQRKKKGMDIFDPNYVANSSPFANIDIKSGRPSAVKIGYGKRNPNEVQKNKKNKGRRA